MNKFIVWVDGCEADAVMVQGMDMPDAIQAGADVMGVDVPEVNIIDASEVVEARYYKVEHALWAGLR